ncbi:methyltransferase domain-containing protein [Fluviispira sanaruensis]|uniref:Class I SAM-dependent methyltransferase n=1 Tax=Fluviispira sanaruensis TaxID=2493639 RepID=A0A4V0P2Q8_FLUSA|nr:methyltransferase domain-containing protein [Fluviispira sanaruensis]BBH54077.1 class I SAM-dependent methyltransferase [Fluviispira sanaruensis]
MVTKNYHDFVIKDGKFIGEFDEMYQNIEDSWFQSNIIESISRQIKLINLRKFGVRSAIEYGCGLGYFTNEIKKNTNCLITGVDISKTDIDKAKVLFPDVQFMVDEVTNIKNYAHSEAIIFAEITWYILDEIDKIFEIMLQYLPNKFFFQNLTFYQGGEQKYGRNYFTTLEEFIKYCPFKLIEKVEVTPSDAQKTIETHAVFKIIKK